MLTTRVLTNALKLSRPGDVTDAKGFNVLISCGPASLALTDDLTSWSSLALHFTLKTVSKVVGSTCELDYVADTECLSRAMLAPQEPEPEPRLVDAGTQTEFLPAEFTLNHRHVRLYAPQRVYIIWRLGTSHLWSGVHFGERGWSGVRRLLPGGTYRAGRDILCRQQGGGDIGLLGAAVDTYLSEHARHGAHATCCLYYWQH
eukprot:6462957-Amphidinium_carterae.6